MSTAVKLPRPDLRIFTFCCCCNVCLRPLCALLEVKVWPPGSSSVFCHLKLCRKQNEWVLIFPWTFTVDLIANVSLPPPPSAPPRLQGLPCVRLMGLCRVKRRVRAWHRVGARSSHRLRVGLAAVNAPDVRCCVWSWASRTRMARCLLPSLRFNWSGWTVRLHKANFFRNPECSHVVREGGAARIYCCCHVATSFTAKR